ncbi:MAG: hypothetical protein H6623_03950 [Bdellovibrionaceae bacterium]|nr:hypothetical protein [Pseudobdellovibrionaceae bacterium]
MSIKSIFITAYLLLTSHAHAFSLDNDTLFAQTHHKFGLSLDSWKYEEPGIMQDSGFLSGAEYNFRAALPPLIYVEAAAEFLYGQTTYKGSSLVGNIPLSFPSTSIIGMGQLYVGWIVPLPSGVTFIPKVGALYRLLIDFNDPSTSDYQRDQSYFSIPIGGDVLVSLDSGYMSAGAVFTTSFSGKNKTHLSQVGGNKDLNLTQNSGRGLLANISYFYTQARFPWYISIVYNEWHIEPSSTEVATIPNVGTKTFIEPKNQTHAFGVRVGMTL